MFARAVERTASRQSGCILLSKREIDSTTLSPPDLSVPLLDCEFIYDSDPSSILNMNSYTPRQAGNPPPPCTICYFIHFVDILCSNITLFHESLSNNTMRRTCARPPRAHAEILPNPLVFQHFQHRMSIKHMKTYDFLIQKVSKICPRALAESLKNQWFFNIPVKVAFTGNFRVHVDPTQHLPRSCPRRHPCQIIPCGAHARGRRARVSKSFQTHWFFNMFNIACQ